MTFQMDTTVLVNLVMKELIVKKVCKISGVLLILAVNYSQKRKKKLFVRAEEILTYIQTFSIILFGYLYKLTRADQRGEFAC